MCVCGLGLRAWGVTWCLAVCAESAGCAGLIVFVCCVAPPLLGVMLY